MDVKLLQSEPLKGSSSMPFETTVVIGFCAFFAFDEAKILCFWDIELGEALSAEKLEAGGAEIERRDKEERTGNPHRLLCMQTLSSSLRLKDKREKCACPCVRVCV